MCEATTHPTQPRDRPAGRSEAGRGPARRARRRLSLTVRIGLWVAGVVAFVLGLAGLVLPGLQGILLLVLALALLSLASNRVYDWLESFAAGRWPRIWRRIENFRTRVHWRFRRRRGEDD